MIIPLMSKYGTSSRIEELRTHLKNDWKGNYTKYPDQAIFALADSRVTEAIEKRFEKNGTIKEIKSLEYDFYSGFNRIYFEFTPATGSIGLPSPDAFLVIMDSNCRVVGILDPFDPVQPNPLIPPLPPKEGEQPFVLSRPSRAEELTFDDKEIHALQVRSREFYERLTSERKKQECFGMTKSTGAAQEARSNANEVTFNSTLCNWMTSTPWGDGLDWSTDDCGPDDVFET
jgi:hypothetical protein